MGKRSRRSALKVLAGVFGDAGERAATCDAVGVERDRSAAPTHRGDLELFKQLDAAPAQRVGDLLSAP